MRHIAFLCLLLCACETPPEPPPDDPCANNPLADACLPSEPVIDRPSAPIEIVRDDMGIAHVYAENGDDAYYGSGYAQASDRLLQMDLMRRRAYGTRAEVLGAEAVSDDELARVLDLRHWTDLSRRDALRRDLSSYRRLVAWVAGVNARIADIESGRVPLPNGFGELGYMPEPFTVLDAFAVGKLVLFANAQQLQSDALATIVRDYLPDLDARLPLLSPLRDAYVMGAAPSTSAPASAAPMSAPAIPPDMGERMREMLERWHSFAPGASNNWAVSGAYTENGRPLIAGDPHQDLSRPAIVWPHHMSTSDGSIDVIGFSFVGTPSVQLGHNRRVAWTATTSYPDWMDMWSVPLDSDSVELGGARYPIVHRREEIRVRGESVSRVLDAIDVPGHGVIVPEGTLPLPLARPREHLLLDWVGFAPTNDAIAFQQLDAAEDLDDVDAAVDSIELGAFNFIAADAGGITYRSSPRVPIRNGAITEQRRPYTVLDGSDADSMWSGRFLSIDVLPHGRGERGWLASANNDPYGYTGDGSVVGDPLYFGVFFDPGTRASRIGSELDRLIARGSIRLDEMQALQRDHYLVVTEDLLPPLFAAWDSRESDETLGDLDLASLEQMVASLRAWDGQMSAGSHDALLFTAYMHFLAKRVIGDELSFVFDPLQQASPTYLVKILVLAMRDRSDSFFGTSRTEAQLHALADVRDYLRDRFGGVEAQWGDVHASVFPSLIDAEDGLTSTTDGALGTIDVSECAFDPAANRCDSIVGAVYRMTARFADDGVPEAFVNMPLGVSGEPSSPHYMDLHADWRSGVYRPLAFRRADVDARATETITLAP